MKIIKKIALPALLCCSIVVSIVSCKDENIGKSDVIEKSKDLSASRKLAALSEKINPSDEEINEYVEQFRKLSLDESMEFRKLQHEKIKSEMGNKPGLAETLEKDMKFFKQINEQSMSSFAKPINQLSNDQMDKAFLAYEAKSGKSAKVAACPPVTFNAGFTRGVGGTTNLRITSIREVSQPGSLNDCDCQISFATSNTNFRKLRPINFAGGTLLNLFGGNISGRQFSGTGGGSYPVFGASRVAIAYIGGGCAELGTQGGQFTLSNN